MKRSFWKKHHKWFGLVLSFFLIVFSVSGIILNHRKTFEKLELSRSFLPESYRFKNWNNGLIRGSHKLSQADGRSSVLLFGIYGLWQTDSLGTAFSDYNEGLPTYADGREIRSLVQTTTEELFTLTSSAVYRRLPNKADEENVQSSRWRQLSYDFGEEEILADLTTRGDTLVVLSRSFVYTALPPYENFSKHQLEAVEGEAKRESAFRTVWLLHSGEIFGLAGKLFVDFLALVIILLCISGIAYWFIPVLSRKFKSTKQHIGKYQNCSLYYHNLLGRKTFYAVLFLCITGWFLRPPLLIAIARLKVPAIPFSHLDSPNFWFEKLRMIRYDEELNAWLVSTNKGFYQLQDLKASHRNKECSACERNGRKRLGAGRG